jgi:hypothetical protein
MIAVARLRFSRIPAITMFSRFIHERRQAIGQGTMGQQDKDALFQQFQSWQREQSR